MLRAVRYSVQRFSEIPRLNHLLQHNLCSFSPVVSLTHSSAPVARHCPLPSTVLSRARLTMSSAAPLSTSTAPATSAPASSDSSTTSTSTAAAAAAIKAKRSAYNDTALHVLKGAIVNILGPSAAVTASVAFSTPYKATLSIVWPGDALPLDTITAIEQEANRIIHLSLPIHSLTLPRKEAEQRYTANPVNHTYIYDRFPVPESIDPLTIALIDGINVNCCMGPHTSTTADLRRLRVLKAKKGKVKDKDGSTVAVLEFLFLVHEGAEESFAKSEEEAGKSMKAKPVAVSGSGAATGAAGVKASGVEEKKEEAGGEQSAESGLQPAVKRSVQSTESMPAFGKWRAGQPNHVRQEAEAVLAMLKKRMVAGSDSSAALNGLDVELERRLVMFSNVCYTMGFTAARDVHIVDRAGML